MVAQVEKKDFGVTRKKKKDLRISGGEGGEVGPPSHSFLSLPQRKCGINILRIHRKSGVEKDSEII